MRRSPAHAALGPAGRWLLLVDDEGEVLRAPVGGGQGQRLRIGRDADSNDIFVDHPSCPVHALLIVERDGVDVLKVYDGARVGLNGAMVQGMHRLYAGDRVRVGDRTFIYGRDDTPPDLAFGFTVVFGGEVQHAAVIRDARIALGRQGDVPIDDPSVHDLHAVVEAYADQAVFAVPVAGVDTIWLDGVRLERRRPLTDGSILQLGRVEVHVRQLPADGAGLLALLRRRSVEAPARPPQPLSSPAPAEVPAVTVIGSLATVGLDPAALDPSEEPEAVDAWIEEATAPPLHQRRDRGRPQHWSSGATPPPGGAVAAPLATDGPSVRVRPRPAEAPSAAPRPASAPPSPAPVVQDRLAPPPRPPPQVVDVRAQGKNRAVLAADPGQGLVPTQRPGLHEAETATLDTRAVPELVEAAFRARGQAVPAWARTGAHAPRQDGALPLTGAVDHDAPTDPRPLAARGASRPAATGEDGRYRPSQLRQSGAHPPPGAVAQQHNAAPQHTVALAPVPDAPRLAPGPLPPPPAAQVAQELPVIQGYSHHDPARLAQGEQPPPPVVARGPTDEAARHHARRVVDGSARHTPGGDGKGRA